MLIWSVFCGGDWSLRPPLDVPVRQNFIWMLQLVLTAELEGHFQNWDGRMVAELKVLCSVRSSVDCLLSPFLHSLPVWRHFFRWKLKWNLAVLPLRPLKVSQVLTSSLLTSLRHKNGSLPHLFGRHCSGHRMHLVISVSNHIHSWHRAPRLAVPSLMGPICTNHDTRSLAAGSLMEKRHIWLKWKSSVLFGPKQQGAVTFKRHH